jgi:tRNA(Ile)-lysidine synthase
MSIIDQTTQTIKRFEMIAPGDRVLVAVSGGPDSVALFCALNSIKTRLEISLAIAHLNHGIRPLEADKEAAFVRQMARNHNTPCYHSKITLDRHRGALEERARKERYAFLSQTARSNGYTKIALGHQADDNAEAVLMNLMRGAGVRGIGGIPPVRDRWIIRPFIDIRRHQILDYLETQHMAYIQDASNEDIRFTRNRIRHQLLPMLEENFNKDIVGTLNRMAVHCRDEEAWFRDHLFPLFSSAQEPMSDGSLVLNLAKMADNHPAIQRRLIRYALEHWQGHLQRLAAVHVDAVLGMISKGKEAQLNLPDGLVAQCANGCLQFFFQSERELSEPTSPVQYAHTIHSKKDLPASISIPACDGKMLLNMMQTPPPEEWVLPKLNRAWLDAESISFPLVIRNARPGDRIAPLGMQGSQKLKEVFINANVPRQKRWTTPMVISNDQVVWVAGLRRSRLHLVTDATKNVLALEWVASTAIGEPMS